MRATGTTTTPPAGAGDSPMAPADVDAPNNANVGKLEPIERYLSVLRSQRQLADLTVQAYRRDLWELARHSGDLAWSAVGQPELRRLAARMHAQGLSPRSIARKLSSWRGFFRWLAREGVLPANPADGVRAPKRPKPLPKALSVDAAVQLVAAPIHAGARPNSTVVSTVTRAPSASVTSPTVRGEVASSSTIRNR